MLNLNRFFEADGDFPAESQSTEFGPDRYVPRRRHRNRNYRQSLSAII
jgi:hypothetical protein